jgi:osmotically-inducible protein OsmY
MTRLATAALLCLIALLAGCAAVVVGGAVAGGTAVAVDRRQADVMATDERIEIQATNRITEIFKDKGHINVTSYNKQVLLTGEAPNEALKQDAERAAATTPEVRTVVNELVIAPPSDLAGRSTDTYLTSLVKSRFVTARKFNPLHVKVVTERGTVYLMGLVTRREADDATQIARTTSGVKRVVRVFEYIPDPPPAPKPAPAEPPKQ